MKLSEEQKTQALKLLCVTPGWTLIKAYNDNKELIHNYTSNKEGYTSSSDSKILGVELGIFVVIFLAFLGLFVWAIIALVKYGKTMPNWSLATSIILLFIIGPVIPLILIYITKGSKKESSFNFF